MQTDIYLDGYGEGGQGIEQPIPGVERFTFDGYGEGGLDNVQPIPGVERFTYTDVERLNELAGVEMKRVDTTKPLRMDLVSPEDAARELLQFVTFYRSQMSVFNYAVVCTLLRRKLLTEIEDCLELPIRKPSWFERLSAMFFGLVPRC